MAHWVYAQTEKLERELANMLLGRKGASLSEMTSIGIPVPPGFAISTEVCEYFHANNRDYPSDLNFQVEAALSDLGKLTNPHYASL